MAKKLMTKEATKKDLYQEITDRIIEQLEKGTIPWHQPWVGVKGAFNRANPDHQYSLLNQLLLKHSGEYASFKQWHDLGGKIKKDEKAEFIYFFKWVDKKATDEDGEEVIDGKYCFLRCYPVFHISQVEGVEPLEVETPTLQENDRKLKAEDVKTKYFMREKLKLEEGTDNSGAFYSPIKDYVNVPAFNRFKSAEGYYSTLFHEVVHSTGHSSRLNRFENGKLLAPFGSCDYSKEELVAELGSAMLANKLGFETNGTFDNSAAYIQSWLKVLKNDKRLIVSAATKADKAVKYILGDSEE